VTWGEQAKDAPSGGSWTVNRLSNEGVLGAVKHQVAGGNSFRLVVSSPAQDLETLSSRARATTSVAEFTEVLAEPLRAVLQNLLSAWDTSTQTAWMLLKRVVVKHHTNSGLRRLVSLTYGRILTDDPDLVVDGPAGYGKSTVVSEVATALSAAGWFVAVARMDGVDATTNTSDKLGAAIGLAESPAVLLAGVADGSPALFVVDQLDAVSTYSGRMPDAFDAVAEMLDEITAASNVKVLLVARTADIAGDPRLRAVVADSVRVERVTIGLLTIEDVRSLLTGAGTTVPASPTTLELLRTPLHLAVFSRLSDAARDLTYRTLPELYERFTSEVRRDVERRVGSLDWAGITGRLVSHMSDHEVLMAPAIVLDAASPREVGALESASVLVRDGSGVGFFRGRRPRRPHRGVHGERRVQRALRPPRPLARAPDDRAAGNGDHGLRTDA
jgi:hypothetical protein